MNKNNNLKHKLFFKIKYLLYLKFKTFFNHIHKTNL